MIIVPLQNPSRLSVGASLGAAPLAQPPVLNDDVLHEIGAYLSWEDQLALSMTSKHVFKLGIPCLSEFTCTTITELRNLHHYLKSENAVHLRARRVARFRALCLVCEDYESALPRGLQELFELINTILGVTANLSFLDVSLPVPLHLTPGEIRPLPAHLTHIRFSTDGSFLDDPEVLPQTIQTLHISAYDDPTRITFDALFSLIARLPSLSTLVLDNIEFLEYECPSNNTDTISFPSIQTLRLFHCMFPQNVIPPLASVLPNLATFHIKETPYFPVGHQDSDHALEHIILDDHLAFLPPSWTTRRITYTNPTGTEVELGFDDIINLAATTCLRIRADTASPFIDWEYLIDTMPQLRLVEVESHGTSLPRLMELLADASQEYNSLSRGYTHPLHICITLLVPSGAPGCSSVLQEDVDAARDALLVVTKDLPNLRYIAYAEHPTRLGLGRTISAKTADEVEPEDYSGDGAPWQWWRIVRERDLEPGSSLEGDPGDAEDRFGSEEDKHSGENGEDGKDGRGEVVEVRQIPAWEGERVRAFLRSADPETAGAFEKKFQPLR